MLWPVSRLTRAVGITILLLANVGRLHRLPWGYIRTLPRTDRRIRFATTCLGISTTSLLVAVAVPAALTLAVLTGAVGALGAAITARR